MTNCSVMWSRLNIIGWTSFLSCSCLVLILAPATNADDGTVDALKPRSAAERWQRVKKQYPADPPTPRRQQPSRLPDDQHPVLPDDQIPPSPADGLVIPRMSALPVDMSNDWILPVRQPIADDVGLRSVPVTARVDDATLNKGTPGTAADEPTPVPAPTGNPAEMNPLGNSRALHARKIGEITPYYDRDRDKDIREFATEKAREVEVPVQEVAYTQRSFPQIGLAWEPTNFFYHPLYFSDPALERYGHAHNPLIQPFASIGRFGAQFVLLPYQMTINPPCKDEYPLGYYRPGECAPKLHYQLPLNAEAAAVEAAVITGLFFIIP
jgi:hypothetical protein